MKARYFHECAKIFFHEKAKGHLSSKIPHGYQSVNTNIRKRSSGILITVFINAFETIGKCHKCIFRGDAYLLHKLLKITR